MDKLKHWKWQVAIGAPLMPPVYLYYGDWLNTLAKGFGWDEVMAAVSPVVLMLAMSVALAAAFGKFREKDD